MGCGLWGSHSAHNPQPTTHNPSALTSAWNFPVAIRRKSETVPILFDSALHPFFFVMSQHRSLKGASKITVKRNVLKRFERVELMKKRGTFTKGTKVIGLPKTKPDA